MYIAFDGDGNEFLRTQKEQVSCHSGVPHEDQHQRLHLHDKKEP